MRDRAREYVERWNMEPHPEGGYYTRTYESDVRLTATDLPERFNGERRTGSAILYLLTGRAPSTFHRISADEMWHFYDGNPVTIHLLEEGVGHRSLHLTPPSREGSPQQLVPHDTWFGAEVDEGFALVGCTVWPEFDFEDYERATPGWLKEMFPDHDALVDRLTMEP